LSGLIGLENRFNPELSQADDRGISELNFGVKLTAIAPQIQAICSQQEFSKSPAASALHHIRN
jgi:hypothetical protein